MSDSAISERMDLVRQYGDDPIAYSTLQPGLRYLDASFGYIAYQRAFGMDITLGPPVCAPADRGVLLDRFLRDHRRPVFCYLRKDCTELLHNVSQGALHISGMGVDRIVDLQTIAQPTAHRPAVLSGAQKKARRAGFHIQRVHLSTLSTDEFTRLHEITNAYLSRSQLPYEMRFLNRPMSFSDDGLARIYLLRQEQGGREGTVKIILSARR